jgi:hypothetical protein
MLAAACPAGAGKAGTIGRRAPAPPSIEAVPRRGLSRSLMAASPIFGRLPRPRPGPSLARLSLQAIGGPCGSVADERAPASSLSELDVIETRCPRYGNLSTEARERITAAGNKAERRAAEARNAPTQPSCSVICFSGSVAGTPQQSSSPQRQREQGRADRAKSVGLLPKRNHSDQRVQWPGLCPCGQRLHHRLVRYRVPSGHVP